jgi:hypothetical protein
MDMDLWWLVVGIPNIDLGTMVMHNQRLLILMTLGRTVKMMLMTTMMMIEMQR